MYEHAPAIPPRLARLMNDPVNPPELAAFMEAWLELCPEYRYAFTCWALLVPIHRDFRERDLFDPRQAPPEDRPAHA